MDQIKSLTVLTIMSSIFALQACSEGITSADEALSNLSSEASSEATDLSAISIGAANPTGTETTIPVTTSTISNYNVNNTNLLPASAPPPSPVEELEPDLVPETDSEVVTDTPPVTDETEVASVDFTPVLEFPVEGELVPYGSTIKYAWSIPVTLFGAVTGFDVTMADASEGIVFYRNNLVTMSSCSYNGRCTYEISSADLPIPEGDNIWSVSSTGEGVSFNIAEASFTVNEIPEAKIAGGLSILSPADGFVADSSSVDFAWEDQSNPAAVYDLHVYSDAARTQKVSGTNGVIFDTVGIGTATSYTFTDDPSNGETRYGQLWQWPDASYDDTLKEEILFEYTAHTETIVTTGRLNNDPAFTDNAADIAKAFEYENVFWNYISSFESNADAIGSQETSATYYAKTYSGTNGVRFYHLYDDMFSLGKVLRLTYIERPTHAAKYKEIALRYIRENVSIFVNYTGLEDAPSDSGAVWHSGPNRWRYLDGTRAMAWIAYLMDSVLYTDNSYAAEFSAYANDMKPQFFQYLERADDPGIVPHMASHPALGAMILGRIGGFTNDIKDYVVDAMTINVVPNVSPWGLSDISHAAQSEQALFYIYESNIRGQSLAGLESINKDLISALAAGAVTRMNNNTYGASVSPHTESYGELVKFSSALMAHTTSASNYTNSNNSRISVAHIAYGYAINDE